MSIIDEDKKSQKRHMFFVKIYKKAYADKKRVFTGLYLKVLLGSKYKVRD